MKRPVVEDEDKIGKFLQQGDFRPGKVRTLKKHSRINKIPIDIEYIKASIRAKVEHPFRILKCQFEGPISRAHEK